jgi:hypothetical protein
MVNTKVFQLGGRVMKKMTFDIQVSPWLNEDGLVVNLYAGDSDIETELNFTLEELVDNEINAYTIDGKLREPWLLDDVIKCLENVTQHAKKRVKELS